MRVARMTVRAMSSGVLRLAKPTQDVLLVAVLDIAARCDGIAFPNRLNHVMQRDAVRDESLGIDGDVNLPDEPSE